MDYRLLTSILTTRPNTSPTELKKKKNSICIWKSLNQMLSMLSFISQILEIYVTASISEGVLSWIDDSIYQILPKWHSFTYIHIHHLPPTPISLFHCINTSMDIKPRISRSIIRSNSQRYTGGEGDGEFCNVASNRGSGR